MEYEQTRCSSTYYAKLAAAYVRGLAAQSWLALPPKLAIQRLDDLQAGELEEILAAGKEAGAKLYYFKNTHDELPRVRRVLGFLKSIEMDSLLDVGSGRGAFLWPCLEAFPDLDVLSMDLLAHRVKTLQTVRQGGVAHLDAVVGDFCKPSIGDKAFDVVTLLEVLEHIPDVATAIQSAVRIARKYVVVTVPSKPDNNPEHIHLLTKGVLTDLFRQAGCERLHFDGVPGHLVMIAALEEAL